jgi:Cys-rich protein (TIGR01571 family)
MPARFAQTVSRARLTTMAMALLMYGLPWLLVIIFYSIDMNYSTTYEYEYDQYGRQVRVTRGALAWAVALAGICNMIMVFVGCTYRGKIREQFGIQGSSCEDCLLHSFCTLCAVTQEARHVDRDTGYLRI